MSEITIMDIIHTFRYRWKLFLSIFLITVLLSVIYIVVAKPKYEVKAVVKAEIFSNKILGLRLANKYQGIIEKKLIPMTPIDKVGSEIELIKSRAILGKVIFDMGLNIKAKLPPGYWVAYRKTVVDTVQSGFLYRVNIEGGKIKIQESNNTVCEGEVGDTIDCNLFLISIEGKGKGGKGVIEFVKPSKSFDDWKGVVSVDQQGLTDLINITVSHDSVKLSREVANRLALYYVNYETKVTIDIVSRIRTRLLALLDSTQRRIDELNRLLESIKTDTIPVLSFALDAMTDKAVAEALKWYFRNPGDPKLRNLSKKFTEKQFRYYELYELYTTIVEDRNEIVKALHEVDMNEAGIVPSSYVVAWASLPSKPVWPRKKLIILIGIVLGIILAMGIVLIYDLMDRRINSPLQLKRLAGGKYPVFFSPNNLKKYLALRGWEKVHCIGKGPDDIGNYPLEDAVAVCINPRGMDSMEFIHVLRSAEQKPVVFLFK